LLQSGDARFGGRDYDLNLSRYMQPRLSIFIHLKPGRNPKWMKMESLGAPAGQSVRLIRRSADGNHRQRWFISELNQ